MVEQALYGHNPGVHCCGLLFVGLGCLHRPLFYRPPPPVPLGQSAPGSFSELAARLSPTVVNVKVVKVEKVASFPSFPQEEMPEGPFKEFFDKFFHDMPNGIPNLPQNPRMPRIQGAGSGVIISKDGYVLTNNHVVEGAKEITITLADHKEYKARIVGRDPRSE